MIPDTLTFKKTDDIWAEMGVVASSRWINVQFYYARENDFLSTSFRWRMNRWTEVTKPIKPRYYKRSWYLI